jgi:hypothetical protein
MALMSRRPTPAGVIAVGALVIAFGGTSYAAGKISGSQIKRHTIAGNRMKPNTLTGAQINESKLAKVPAATKADRATEAAHAATADSAKLVDGARVLTFDFTVKPDGGLQVLVVPGGKFYASCPSGIPDLSLYGAQPPDTADETLAVAGDDGANGAFGGGIDNFSTNSGAVLTPSDPQDGAGTGEITRPPSGVTTINFSYAKLADGCRYAGTAIATV